MYSIIDELQQAIMQMKNNKSSGTDDLPYKVAYTNKYDRSAGTCFLPKYLNL